MFFFEESFRQIFALVNSFLAGIISKLYGLILQLADIRLMDQLDNSILRRMYALIGIFMCFKAAIIVIRYVVTPEQMFDGKVGGRKLIINILITLAMLTGAPTVFKQLEMIQKEVLKSNALPKLFMGETVSPDSSSLEELGNEISYYMVASFMDYDHTGDMRFVFEDCPNIFFEADANLKTDVVPGYCCSEEGCGYIYAKCAYYLTKGANAAMSFSKGASEYVYYQGNFEQFDQRTDVYLNGTPSGDSVNPNARYKSATYPVVVGYVEDFYHNDEYRNDYHHIKRNFTPSQNSQIDYGNCLASCSGSPDQNACRNRCFMYSSEGENIKPIDKYTEGDIVIGFENCRAQLINGGYCGIPNGIYVYWRIQAGRTTKDPSVILEKEIVTAQDSSYLIYFLKTTQNGEVQIDDTYANDMSTPEVDSQYSQCACDEYPGKTASTDKTRGPSEADKRLTVDTVLKAFKKGFNAAVRAIQNYANGVESSDDGVDGFGGNSEPVAFDYVDGSRCDKSAGGFVFEYNYLLMTLAQLFTIAFFILLSIDVAIRTVKLAFLKVISPIPIVSFIDVKESSLFKNWLKVFISTFLDLFIKLGAIFLSFGMIRIIISDGLGIEALDNNSFAKILMVIACLFFAKQLPDVLSNGLGLKGNGGVGDIIKKSVSFAIGAATVVATGVAGGAANTVGAIGEKVSAVDTAGLSKGEALAAKLKAGGKALPGAIGSGALRGTDAAIRAGVDHAKYGASIRNVTDSIRTASENRGTGFGKTVLGETVSSFKEMAGLEASNPYEKMDEKQLQTALEEQENEIKSNQEQINNMLMEENDPNSIREAFGYGSDGERIYSNYDSYKDKNPNGIDSSTYDQYNEFYSAIEKAKDKIINIKKQQEANSRKRDKK